MNIYTMQMSKGSSNKVGNSKFEKDTNKMVASFGYELLRNKKHMIYKHKITNHILVISKTPKCPQHSLIREKGKLERMKKNGLFKIHHNKNIVNK